jgi:hypothetical protein
VNLSDWLHEPVPHREDTLSIAVSIPRYERIGFLLGCNGGRWNVSQWGIVGYNGGPFRQGLEQDEALELMYYSAFLDGVTLALGGDAVRDIVRPIIDQYFRLSQSRIRSTDARQ